MSNTKQAILIKLQKLEELINKNHENEEDLFPKHWLILLQVKNEVNTAGTVCRETLEKMNKIWKINKKIESAQSTTKFKEIVWQAIDEFLEDGDTPSSIRTFQGSFVKDDGSEYSITEAKSEIKRIKNEKNS